MSKINLLMIGGVPDDNMVEVRAWAPSGVDLLYDGNVTMDAIVHNSRLHLMQLILGGSSPSRDFRLEHRPDVAFNLICNAESSGRALDMANKVCQGLQRDGIPVLNPPHRVRETTRVAGPALFAGLERIKVPEVLKLESPNMRTLRAMLDTGEITYPAIVRTASDHNGRRMVRLLSSEDFDDLESLPLDGRDFYAIPFIDYKNADGLYCKLRLIKVGRAILPRHLILSKDWKIHVAQRSEELNATSETRAREDAYLSDPEGYLGAILYGQLVTGLERSGLDYVGVDFGLRDDGSAVMFECNACTNAATRSPRSNEPPARAAIKRKIEAAFFQCVQEAAHAARVRQQEAGT